MLTEPIARSFNVAQVFRENATVKCMDFSPNGDLLITCSHSNQMNAYNCLKKSSKPDSFVTPSKYGVDHVKFCHDTTGAIHASTMINDSIRFLNIQSLRYLRYFDGHTKKVSGISISPIEDSFVSVSLDKTLKLWDFRVVDRCISFTLPDSVFVPPKVAIDPTGLVIAVCLNSQKLALYDIRKLEAGSFFNSASIEQNGLVMDMKFSTDNTKILYSTNGTSISIVDAHNGKLVHSLTGFQNIARVPIEASFSLDGQFVFSGSDDGRVHIWETTWGLKVCTLDGQHPSPLQCVKFNPKYMMLASACNNVAFWLPKDIDF